MSNVLSTKILQGAEQLMGLFFKKGAVEFVVKILNKYTNEEFLKIPLKNWTSSQISLKDFDHN